MANFRLYDDLTAKALLERMLDRYRYEFDKREGSLTWDEFANVAIELRHLYIQLDWQWKQMFGDTADREALIRLAADRDIYPMPASPAVVLAAFNVPIPIGERFSAGDVKYVVSEAVAVEDPDDRRYRYNLTCEAVGKGGNLTEWALKPVRTVQGLNYARIEKIQIPGEDDEDTEAFRERYYETLRHNKYGFNIAEYQSQVNLIAGVGGVRTYPADPKPGHVRVVIIDSEYMPAEEALISKVQEILDPVPFAQQGIGRAPIGHLVKVETGKTSPINVELNLTLNTDTTFESIKSDVIKVIGDYLLELRKGWQRAYDPVRRTQTGMTVRIAHIDTRVLDIPGVVDVVGTKINGEAKNFNPALDDIPVLGTVSHAES